MTIALRTDHAGLTWVHRSSDINSRLFRWVQQLAEFNYSIQWQPGPTMQIPDALSRVKVAFLAETKLMMIATSQMQPPTPTAVLATTPQPWKIERLVSEHTRMHHTGKFFRVRWAGFPDPDQDTIEPLAKLRSDLTCTQLQTLRAAFKDRATTADDNDLHPPPGFDGYTTTGATHLTPATRTPAQLAADNDILLDTTAPADTPSHDNTSFTANTFPGQQLLPDPSIKQVAAAQRTDTRTANIINNVNQQPCYHIHTSGLLMRTHTPTTGPRAGHTIVTIELPESLIPLALAAAHTACGHHGETSSTFCMQTRFHFPNIIERTRAFVRGCTTCSRAKRDLRPTPIGKMRVCGWLDSVSIDFCGPMRSSLGGNWFIAIIVDNSCKWVHVHPCKSTDAADATAALLSFTQHCGLPGKVVSDRGAAFTSKAWAGLMRAMSAKGRQTSAYRPESNGMAEAQVGNIKTIIKCVCNQFPRSWDEAARWAAWSYNSSYCSTIGCTPAYARTGREPRTVPDIVFNNPNASDSLTLSNLIQRVNAMHRTTQERVEKMHDRFIRRNATLNRTRTFVDRQTVWLHRVYPGIAKPAAGGLNRSFFWPFRPDLYEIIGKPTPQHACMRNKRTGISQHVSTRRLKPYHPQVDCFDFSDLSIQEETTPATAK
jgi:transposase InsO family protein